MHPTVLLVLLAILIAGCATRTAPASSEPVVLPLWSGGVPDGSGGIDRAGRPVITVHRPAKPSGTAVVICPGGGYGGLVTGAEGHGIARWLGSNGIVGIVLEYRLPAGRAEVPSLDAGRAIRLARHHAREWGLKKDRIGIMGFSAGGHLATTAATRFDFGDRKLGDAVGWHSSRPDFAVLIYPVISMGPKGHGGSRQNLLGRNPAVEQIERFSAERHVTRWTPPMFLAHAVDDRVVDIAHSRMMAEALKAKGIRHRLLELPDGDHGLNGYKGPSWDAWQRESLRWMWELTSN